MVAEPLPSPISKLPLAVSAEPTDYVPGIVWDPDKFGPGVGGWNTVKFTLDQLASFAAGAAPQGAEYLVATPHAVLTAERVLINTATVSWDFSTPGEAKASAIGTLSNGPHGDIIVSGDGATLEIGTNTVGANELSATGVLPGIYTNANITVDSDGRITLASSGFSGIADGPHGDITVSGSGTDFQINADAVGTPEIANQAVTYAKLQNVTGGVFLGNTSPTGPLEEIPYSLAAFVLPVFTSSAKGVVPASGGGTANFLRADGTFAIPPGGSSTNSFGTIQVAGQSDVVADTAPDILTLFAGANITITTNAATDTITIAAAASPFDINALPTDAPVLTDTFPFFDVSGSDQNKATFSTLNGILAITGLSGYVANEHINHTSVVLTAGAGLTGGGDITTNRTFAVGAGAGITVNPDDVALNPSSLMNVDHSGVVLLAGNGLTGGGDITVNRSFHVGAGVGITVNADDVALNPASSMNTDHSTISINAGAGLVGGGDITTTRTIDVGQGAGISVSANSVSLEISNLGFDTPTLADSIPFFDDSAGDNNRATIGTVNGILVHNSLAGILANEHVNHSGVVLTAGAGLTGGGDITLSRSFAVGAGTGISVAADSVALDPASNMNIDHSGVSITAGAGLTGGGDITTSRTIDVGSGAGISVAANSIAMNISSLPAAVPVQADSFAFFDADGAVTAAASIADLNGILIHNSLSGTITNEHINHASVVLTAGAGLTGGGDITASRSFAVGAGQGIAVNADDVALNFNGLTADTPVSGDFYAFYDTSGSDHNKIEHDAFKTALGVLSGFGSGVDNRIARWDGTNGLQSNPVWSIDDGHTLYAGNSGNPNATIELPDMDSGSGNFFDMVFKIKGNSILKEQFRIQYDGSTLIGELQGHSSISPFGSSQIQTFGRGNWWSARFARYGNNTLYPKIAFTTNRSTTSADSHTAGDVSQLGDYLGGIDFYGCNGQQFRQGAGIFARVPTNGTISFTSFPGQLELWTTRNGDQDPSNSVIVRMDGSLNPLYRVLENEEILTDAANITLSAVSGNTYKVTTTASRTLNAPTEKPASGEVQKFVLAHTASGGNWTLSLETGVAGGFRFGSDITALTATVDGKTDYIGFIYNDAADRWDVVSYSKGY